MKAIFSRKMSTGNSSLDSTSSSTSISHPTTKSAKQAPAIAGQAPHYTEAFVHDEDPEELCPVCHEDISLRLQGEKPHVVPSCGHKLHAACFENVYTTIAEARKTSGVYGCCGTCRKDMRLGDVVSGGPSSRTHTTTSASFMTAIDPATSGNLGNKKLVAMTGGLDSTPRIANHKVHSVTRKAALAAAATSTPATFEAPVATEKNQHYDPDNDDELLNILDDHSSGGSDPSPRQYRRSSQVIQPVIQAISESSSLAQPKDASQTQHITCMVSVEIPSRYPTQSLVPTPSSATFSSVHSPLYNQSLAGCSISTRSRPSLPSIFSAGEYDNIHSFPPPERGRACPKVKSYPTLSSTTPSIRSGSEPSSCVGLEADMAHSMAENLLSRIQNWKGHSLSDFGTLKLCDRLYVRKEYKSREFLVYLFEEALLCVSEDHSRPMDGISQSSSARLRLKGRVYIRHMTSVHDSSPESPLTLTIKMEDDNMEAFVMLFQERAHLKLWLKTLELLIHKHLPDCTRERLPLPATPTPPAASSETSPSGEGLHMTTADGRAEAYTSSEGGYASSSFTGYTRATNLTSASTLSSVGEENAHEDRQFLANRHPTRKDSFGRSATSFHHHILHSRPVFESIPPRSLSIRTTPEPIVKVSPMAFNSSLGVVGAFHVGDLAPIDLLLMISIPTPHAVSALAPMPSSANMKLRLIKECLQSITRNLHPRSRLSLIVYSVGNSNLNSTGRCQLRKTPFLSVGCEFSRRRLEYVIEQVGQAGHCSNILNCDNERYYSEFFDEALPDHAALEERLKMTEIDQGPERISVVTAVNLAYDNILQRKQKNPLSGMLLIHDSHDLSTKDQMALVMTRAESSNVPIHTIGWGKAHNPSSLLQISNHTGGTYSFVKDLPSIKDVVTGCIGGMLSVGATNAKLRISVPEHIWFKIKKLSGVERYVLSSNGQNADVELGELRYGEKRDILLEMEMSRGGGERGAGDDAHLRGRYSSTQALTGTDAFFLQHGAELKEIGMGDGAGTLEFYEAEFNQLCDDVPLLEVDASYRDPIAGKSVSRLVRPVLLSLTITPPRPMMNLSLGAGTLGGSNEPGIVRRRVELLTAGCLSRAMLLISRRLERQADRLLDEARTIVLTVLGSGQRASGSGSGRAANRKTRDEALAKEVLAGCLYDLETMLAAVEELTRITGEASADTSNSRNEVDRAINEEQIIRAYHSFDSDTRNFIAQQAGVLRNQRAWTGRTLTESKFWKADRSMIYSMRCMHFSSA